MKGNGALRAFLPETGFGFSIALRPEAFGSVEMPVVQRLNLLGADRDGPTAVDVELEEDHLKPMNEH